MQHRLFLLSLQTFRGVHCLDCIKFHNYFSFCKNQHPRTRSYHPSHLLTCVSRENPYSYSFLVNALFIWNAIPGSILCVLCPVTFRSLLIYHFFFFFFFWLFFFFVFLSFVSLGKRSTGYSFCVPCIMQNQFNSTENKVRYCSMHKERQAQHIYIYILV